MVYIVVIEHNTSEENFRVKIIDVVEQREMNFVQNHLPTLIKAVVKNLDIFIVNRKVVIKNFI